MCVCVCVRERFILIRLTNVQCAQLWRAVSPVQARCEDCTARGGNVDCGPLGCSG